MGGVQGGLFTPNAAATPAAQPAETKSLLEWSFRNDFQCFTPQFRQPCGSMHYGRSAPHQAAGGSVGGGEIRWVQEVSELGMLGESESKDVV